MEDCKGCGGNLEQRKRESKELEIDTSRIVGRAPVEHKMKVNDTRRVETNDGNYRKGRRRGKQKQGADGRETIAGHEALKVVVEVAM